MKVAALAKHPEEIGDVEVVVGSYDEAAPGLCVVREQAEWMN